MKYNGKEVTEEILNRIWEKTNEGVGKFDLKYLQLFFVERVLQAAEEVFAEMQPKHDIKVGDQVRKSAEKDPWYYGQVVSVEGNTANVVWGLVSRPEPCKTNELVKTKEAQHGEG